MKKGLFNLKIKSPSYNSERSDCLNHGFGRPDVASDCEEGRHGAFGGGSGSGASSVISSRITGMYFLHPDHLGSITMITDGRGNAIAGGERGGKSHISYKPYGDIHRTDSFGPDISKYKYTGQEEDRESGLMYYKARYYDARIGRFLQQDSMAFPNQVNGMNRMMYVEGNPVGYRDVSGNKISNSWASSIATYIVAKLNGSSDDDALKWSLSAYAVGRAKDRKSKERKYTSQKSDVQRMTEKAHKYPLGTKMFGKLNDWYGRAVGRDKYENTHNSIYNKLMQMYIDNRCKNDRSVFECQKLFQINAILYGRSKEKYDGNTDPTIGMWDWKIRPNPEDPNEDPLWIGGNPATAVVWMYWLFNYMNTLNRSGCGSCTSPIPE